MEQSKKWVLLCSMCMLFLTLLTVSTVCAQTAVAPAGAGTLESPYQISELGHLVWLGGNVSSSNGKYYKQTKNFSASATATWNDAGTDNSVKEGFKPIGISATPFRGNFDGDGFAITGLTIKRISMDYVGLFGVIGTDGVAKNLALKSVVIKGKSYVGGLVGYSGNASFTGCSVAGTVSGAADYTGGLLGYGLLTTIAGCSATSTVSGGDDYTGGLVGYGSSMSITDSSVTGGAVNAVGNYTGGLLGFGSPATLTNCHASSTVTGAMTGSDGYAGGLVGELENGSEITDSTAAGKVSGKHGIGGLLGFGVNTVTIKNSSASGAVSGHVTLGGLLGNGYEGVHLTDCHATGKVTGGGDRIGGLVGNINLGCSIKDSSATGKVSGCDNVGGLVGGNTRCSITGSSATGAVSGYVGVGGLVGENTDTPSIADCSATGKVVGYDNVGGLVGYQYDTCTIADSFATGKVIGYANVGGLVGQQVNACTITYSYAKGVVSGYDSVGGLLGSSSISSLVGACCASGSTTGASAVGGLVGYSEGTIIADSNASGAVTGADSAGGLLGYNEAGCSVLRCYATGVVKGSAWSGGLVGYNDAGIVADCYATGKVMGRYGAGGLLGGTTAGGSVSVCYSIGKVTGLAGGIGGLVGGANYDLGTNNFWNKETSGLTTSQGGTGKTTAEMQTADTFTGVGWVFGGPSAWNISSAVNSGYPYLVATGAPLNGSVVLTSFLVNSGAAETANRSVSLNFSCTSIPDYYMVGTTPSFAGATWQAYAGGSPTVILSPTNGTRTLYFKVKNAAGKTSAVLHDAITLKNIPVVGTFKINNGAASTGVAAVTLNNTCTAAGAPETYMASESPDFAGAGWQPYSATPSFTLSPGKGVKTVYFKVKNDAGGESAVKSDSINKTVDAAPAPTAAISTDGAVSKTVAKSSRVLASAPMDAPTASVENTTVVTSRTVSAKPDLQVMDYTLIETPNGTFAATLSIANDGNADAGAFHVALYFWSSDMLSLADAVLVQEVAVEGLAAGAETTVTFEFVMPYLGTAAPIPVFVLDSQAEVAAFDAMSNLFNPNALQNVE